MTFTTEVKYTPTPVELANELWEWDAEQQAEFLYSLFVEHGRENAAMIYQIDHVADELKIFDKEELMVIEHRLEDLIERLP